MRWYEYPPSPEREFFHYTSFDSLIAVLESRSLWATSIYYLNDEREFRYGHESIVAQLTKIAAEWYRPQPVQKQFLQDLRHSVEHWDIPNIFVAALSYESDLLSQWRAYCPNGKGVAIGITAKVLAARAKSCGFQFLPCLYSQSQHEELVRIVVREASNALFGGRPPLLEELVDRTSMRLQILAARIKHAAFEEEQEWRLISEAIQPDNPRIEYRSNRALLVPYVDFPLVQDSEALEVGRIVVGPNPHMDLAIRAVSAFVQSRRGVACKTVVPSSAPYRAW